MFGKNIVISQYLEPSGELKIVDLFYTIQGEGPYAGMPSVFVRLAGCNLRCTWCDTDFESKAVVRSLDDLILRIEIAANKLTKLVVITGGEPLLQNIVPLIKELFRRNYRTQIETAGTIWTPGLEGCDVTLVCSPKTGKVNKEILNRCKHFKYVVGVGDTITSDGHVITCTQPGGKEVTLARPKDGTTIWVQPRDDHNEERNALNVKFAANLCLAYGYRMGLQLHKLIGVE
jgi:organic radical activating enzyme